jgi:hypothetical protein
VGIMPPGFYPTRYWSVDLWLPYAFAPGYQDDRVTWSFITLALGIGPSLQRRESSSLPSGRMAAAARQTR